MKRQSKRISLITAIVLTIALLITGCSSGGSDAPQTPAEKNEPGTSSSDGPMNMTEFALSIATPLSAEDKAVDITASSSNPDAVIWRHGIVARNWDENSTERSYRQFFIELKKPLGDKVEIQLYTGGSLGTSADQILGGLQNRNFESYSYNVGAFAEYTKAFMPLDVLYLIPDLEAGKKVSSGEPGELMRQKCIEDTNLNVLVYGAIGMRHMTNSKREILTPDDLKGLKMRVQNNPLHIMGMTALGASPTPIAYAELFTSLQQKVVDGEENPITNIYDQNYGEVQDYMTLTNHLYTAGALVINNDWLLSQSDEFQQAVKESAAIAQEYTDNEVTVVETKMMEKMSEQMKITTLTEEQMEAFKELAMPTWDQAAEKIGVDYFNKIKASIEKTLS